MTLAFQTPRGEVKAALDPAFFQTIHDRLEQARREIEQRFLNAGGVLLEARENIQVLTEALDRIAGSFGRDRADQTIGALRGAIAQLQERIAREHGRGDDLQATAERLSTIQAEISKIHAILGYLAACAVSTRITAAGNDKFMSFADEIANYVQKAEHEVAGFSRKVGQMTSELDRIGEEHAHVIEVVGSAAAAAAPQLIEAAQVVDRRRAELEKLAGHAGPVMHAAASKFGGALSALQVGDMTRQRIEHVQENIQALLDLMRGATDDAGLRIPVLRLLSALTGALSQDFDTDARAIVGALQGVAVDARDIHSLVGNFTGRKGRAEPTHDVVERLGAMRHLVEGIEAAGRRSAEVDGTIRRLAVELLDNKEDIGNLRHVQSDIRLLAINAYLHCSRMGDLGRTIGAIATEINREGDKLGRSANVILQTLGALGGTDAAPADAGGDLVAGLDAVGGALREMDKELGGSIDLIATRGETIAARIDAAVQGLDFSGALGEQLAACSAALRQAIVEAGPAPEAPAEALAAFSEAAYGRYTMNSERELHLNVFPELRARVAAVDASKPEPAEEDVDEFLL